jgi:hypothetical protein
MKRFASTAIVAIHRALERSGIQAVFSGVGQKKAPSFSHIPNFIVYLRYVVMSLLIFSG